MLILFMLKKKIQISGRQLADNFLDVTIKITFLSKKKNEY